MNKPTLLILAAGKGSRYGKLKQLDSFGPNGETIIDYSIYDAIQAGFGKVVLVIRESFRKEIEDIFNVKWADKIECVYVSQEIEKIPNDMIVDVDRTKPWGTGHAVWVANKLISGNFAVINADDFYGRDAFQTIANYFESNISSKEYAVLGYRLKNTLSDNGTVNRGVCFSKGLNKLDEIVECTQIAKIDDKYLNEPAYIELHDDTLVSMNMWAFNESYFDYATDFFKSFLYEFGDDKNTEFYIPSLVDHLIKENQVVVNLLHTDSQWFGVTYQEDRDVVQKKIATLINQRVYPTNLFE